MQARKSIKIRGNKRDKGLEQRILQEIESYNSMSEIHKNYNRLIQLMAEIENFNSNRENDEIMSLPTITSTEIKEIYKKTEEIDNLQKSLEKAPDELKGKLNKLYGMLRLDNYSIRPCLGKNDEKLLLIIAPEIKAAIKEPSFYAALEKETESTKTICYILSIGNITRDTENSVLKLTDARNYFEGYARTMEIIAKNNPLLLKGLISKKAESRIRRAIKTLAGKDNRDKIEICARPLYVKNDIEKRPHDLSKIMVEITY